MIEIQEAVLSLYPEAQFGGPANNGGYDDIRWHVKPDGITKEKVQTEVARLQAEYDAQQYARNRATEYPAITDQLDEIYHNGIDSWKAVIKVTKDKYPKG